MQGFHYLAGAGFLVGVFLVGASWDSPEFGWQTILWPVYFVVIVYVVAIFGTAYSHTTKRIQSLIGDGEDVEPSDSSTEDAETRKERK